MKIIIVGSGKVGFTLAENLVLENHDITIIDKSDEALEKANESLDVLCIKGNGASIGVLKSAGIEHTDLLIATTGGDECNMVCCLTAKKLGAKATIARIRDYEYAMELHHLKREMDLDMVINPEFATATQISRLLRFPEALEIETLFRGRIELVGFRVTDGDIVAGQPLSVVRKKLNNISVLFCAVEHEGTVSIPDGNTVFEPNDKIYVIGTVLNIDKFIKIFGRFPHKIKNVFIVGGGRISVYLAQTLLEMNMKVKIVESNPKKCITLCETLPKALIINGDGTDQELLSSSEDISSSDAFVALTGRDEDNLIIALYAKQVGVPKVIAKITRQNYYNIIDSLNIDSVISPKTITVYSILRYVRAMQNSHGSHMDALYRIAGGGAEAMVFTVSSNTRNVGIPIKKLNLKKGILISVIVRDGRMIIPEGSDYFDAGDSIVIISNGMTILDINDIFAD